MKYPISEKFRIFNLPALILLLAMSFFSVNSQENGDERDPVNLFNQGQEAHENGDYETALRFYGEAIEIFPEFAEAEYQRGMALLSLKKEADAERALRRALEIREDWSLPMTSLGVLLVSKAKFDEAERLLTRAIRLGENNFLAYSALSDLSISSNAPPEKLKELLSTIQYLTTKANPPAALWASRAALERVLGDKKSANISLARAIELDPSDKSALSERAEMAISDGDRDFALEVAQKLRKMSPGSKYADFLLARILALNGDFAKSLEILNVIPEPSAEMIALREKITIYRSEDAADLEKRVTAGIKDPAVFGRLCILYRTSSPSKALENCRLAYELEPDNLSHAVGFGAALVQAHQYQDAISLFRRLIAIAPDNFTAHANLATALFQVKSYRDAIPEYVWITNRKPDMAIAYYFLAISHDNLQEYLDALANYQQFLLIANEKQNQLEIDKVTLRIPGLQSLIKQGKGRKHE